ncbi:polycomb protein Scm isoform X3 [Ooceraea biroi]|nr:polycomb protein Scm isoform X3 [Ooceraea biroi]
MTKMQQHPVAAARIAHEEHILEAIDQLRRRKARPDADRICNYLLRKFSVDARDTIADLHRLIEVEKVIQVDYKGNTSYRNAKKWSRLQLFKNRPEGFLKEKLNSGMVSSAVAELVVEEPDYLDQGVPAGRLIEQLLDGVSSPTSRRVVEEFLGREVASGNLARLSNGNYSLVATSDMATDATPRRGSGGGDSQPASTAVAPRAAENGDAAQRRVGRDAASDGTNGVTTAATTTTTTASATAAAAELYEFNETDNLTDTTSGSNTPRSRQASNSPKLDRQLRQEQRQDCIKKEECYEIIVGRKDAVEDRRSESPRSVEMACNGGDVAEQQETAMPPTATVPNVGNEVKEEAKSNDARTMPNLKRSAKAERKQRLFARTDDRMDIEFKFEDYQQAGKEEPEKREEAGRRSSEDREDEDAGRSSSTNTSPTPSNVNAGGIRSARRKRARKVFDPSDNNLVKRKRGRQPSSHNKNSLIQDSQDTAKTTVKDGPYRQCSLCAKEKQEALVACRDCTVRAHPSCIYSPEEILQKANSNWQCERCKTCTICCETSDAGPLVTCFGCDEAYHYFCHASRVTISKSNSKWYCNECTQKQQCKTNDNGNQNGNSMNGVSRSNSPTNAPILPPVLSPQVSPARASSEQMEEEGLRGQPIDPNIPDARNWTSEQVYQYFARLFPKEAEVFRQQEIDGHALIMMSRMDVLRGLGLLLGPALKIYRHVLKLQMRRDDPELYWQ